MNTRGYIRTIASCDKCVLVETKEFVNERLRKLYRVWKITYVRTSLGGWIPKWVDYPEPILTTSLKKAKAAYIIASI